MYQEIMMGRADLHMHTNMSDGLPSVEDLLDHIASMGTLDVIAITDHDRIDNSLWAYEQRAHYPFDIIPGTEVTSTEGHVLAWWVEKEIPAGLNLEETVAAIHEAGGIAVLAHPFQIGIGETQVGLKRYFQNPNLLAEIGFDGVEVHNAAGGLPGSNWMTHQHFRSTPIAQTGSSDAHTLSGIGSGITRFPGSSSQDLRIALQQRQTCAEGGTWPLAAYSEYISTRANGKMKIETLEMAVERQQQSKRATQPMRVADGSMNG